MLLLDIDHGFFSNFLYTIDTQRSIIHEDINNNPTLLVTIGDSWTWGDSLGRIDLDKNIADDMDHRTSHIFGNLLAKKLDRDFLMLAKCGATNSQIHSMAFGQSMWLFDIGLIKCIV